MKKATIIFFLFIVIINSFAYAYPYTKILIELPNGKSEESRLIAIERMREYSKAAIHVTYNPSKKEEQNNYDLVIVLGLPKDSPELQSQWQKHPAAIKDSYIINSASAKPLIIMASGINDRGILYAAYHLADMLKAGADISRLQLFFQPKISGVMDKK